jgi:hypothetical protein
VPRGILSGIVYDLVWLCWRTLECCFLSMLKISGIVT